MSSIKEELKNILMEDDIYVLKSRERLEEIHAELINLLNTSKKHVSTIKILREAVTLWKRMYSKNFKDIIRLEKEVDKWKDMYRNDVRPKSKMMESQSVKENENGTPDI